MKTPVAYQRIEGAALFLAAVFIYSQLHFSLFWFIILLLSVDVFMLGYLVNAKAGTHVYNIGHSYIIPAALIIIGVGFGARLVIALAIIWFAHIAWDRALGYGLKLETGLKDTHLGRIGKK
jgi:hypothetical protein